LTVESLEVISIFCGIGLLLTLIGIKAYGLDLTAAFFLDTGNKKTRRRSHVGGQQASSLRSVGLHYHGSVPSRYRFSL
jgi:hypothetical protein